MASEHTWDTSRLEKAFTLVAEYSTKSVEAEFRTMCKGLVNQWYAITPPASGRGAKETNGGFDGNAAAAGMYAIRRDLMGGGAGTSAKRAGLFNVLPDAMVDRAVESGISDAGNVRLFARKDGSVYGTDRTHFLPDASTSQLEGIHKANFIDGKMSSAGARTRDIGRWKFIERYTVRQSAMDAFLAAEFKKVGWLASTLNAIARLTGARIPAYARGKSAASQQDFSLGASLLHFKFENMVPWAGGAAGGQMGTLFQSAVNYQANAMFRRIPYLMQAAVKRAGL